MKSLGQTIIVLITLNLITACYALAQPTPAPAPSTPEQVKTAEADADEVQAEAARQQMELAKEQMEAAKSTGERAGKALSKLSKELGELRFNFANPLSHGGAGAVMVIPTSEMKAEDIATITEDMTVMSRIIDKPLGKDSSKQWVYGNFIGHSFGGRISETMYLQGYGALFLRKVDFPLSPTQQAQEKEKEETKKEAADPVWEQTRQEIYEPPEDRRRSREEPEEKYDAEKVENLKTNLIKSLKHAANIRNLKPDESIIITITGIGGWSGNTNIVIAGTPGGVVVKDKTKTKVFTTNTHIGDWGASSSTMLIIRVKKSDIDSFAKGNLDLDKFRKQVQIFTCLQLGGGDEGSVSVVTPSLPTSATEPPESF